MPIGRTILGTGLCFLAVVIGVAFGQSCRDSEAFCTFWQTIGECEKNPDWMLVNCRLSCSQCFSGRNNPAPSNNVRTNPAPVRTNNVVPISRVTNRNDPALCAQVSQFEAANRLPRDGLVVASEDFGGRQPVTLSQARNSNTRFGCTPIQDSFVDCQRNMCYNKKFRSMDGTCNNFNRPLEGAAFMPLMRHKPAQYDDGVDAPMGSIRGGRRSPRDASRFLLSSSQVVTNNAVNGLVMQWGQFLSHDIVKTTMLPNDDCRNCNEPSGSKCISIVVNPLDPSSRTFGCQGSPQGPQCCVRTARSSPVCGTGVGGNNGPRNQFNENTAYIDASQVYGSSVQDSFRFRNGRSGFMRVQFSDSRPFPPFDQSQCSGGGQCTVNFQAGDDRANLFVGLGAMHTLFVREHNRIVDQLRVMNPHWNGDRLYQEARKIVGAEMQLITYKEYLPILFGNVFSRVIGNYRSYSPNVNPTVANVFSTSAFRFGHGMVTEFFRRKNINGGDRPGFRFLDGVFRSNKIVTEGGIDPILIGLISSAAKRPHRITTSMTEQLFGNVDLAAVNIERGREHGIAGYNEWRAFCNLNRAGNFDDFSGEMLDQAVRANLQQEYGSPDMVDLYVGQLLEDPVPGGMVGPTLACLLGEQFKRLRDGDRFWFQNPGVFTTAQLGQLEQFSLSRLLCDNGDTFNRAPSSAFRFTDPRDFTSCNSIRSMDLSAWRE